VKPWTALPRIAGLPYAKYATNFLKPNEALIEGLATLGRAARFVSEYAPLNLAIEIGERESS